MDKDSLLQETRRQFEAGILEEKDLWWFLNLDTAQRNSHQQQMRTLTCYKQGNGEFVPVPPGIANKFALLVDLGVITVPDDYVHEKRLTTFDKQNNRRKFFYYNNEISDENFPNPTRALKPGDKFRVRAFKQVVDGTTTSEERLAFLSTQKTIHTGAQGASLVFDQKRDQLPKGQLYASFDEKDRLWADASGYRKVPSVDVLSNGDFEFRLGDFEAVWGGDSAFLCFNEVDTTEGQTC